MIGLKRGVVKIAPYHKAWKKLFGTEKRRLSRALGDAVVDIQHVGSTSVPGLAAKPLIDIDIGLKTMGDSKKLIRPLTKLGYHYRPRISNPRYHMFFAKGDPAKRTHHIHLVKYGGAVWKRDITFRDYLRTHRKTAKEYEKLKKTLEQKYPTDRQAYSRNKTKFRREVTKRAKEK